MEAKGLSLSGFDDGKSSVRYEVRFVPPGTTRVGVHMRLLNKLGAPIVGLKPNDIKKIGRLKSVDFKSPTFGRTAKALSLT